jgi:hypothetical protein
MEGRLTGPHKSVQSTFVPVSALVRESADAADGYKWRTAATLSEPGVETDWWIGNV